MGKVEAKAVDEVKAMRLKCGRVAFHHWQLIGRRPFEPWFKIADEDAMWNGYLKHLKHANRKHANI